MRQSINESDLNAEEFATLKEYYVDRIVDNMSMKDLMIYVTSDQQKWIDSLTFKEVNHYGETGMDSQKWHI